MVFVTRWRIYLVVGVYYAWENGPHSVNQLFSGHVSKI